MSLTNLWKETMEDLENNGLNWSNVIKIGIGDSFISKNDFQQFAKNYDYYNYYDSDNIDCVPLDLIIEGKDFKMIREKCDGYEGWKVIFFKSFIDDNEVIKFENLNKLFKDPYE